jgi:hypothetical protein
MEATGGGAGRQLRKETEVDDALLTDSPLAHIGLANELKFLILTKYYWAGMNVR